MCDDLASTMKVVGGEEGGGRIKEGQETGGLGDVAGEGAVWAFVVVVVVVVFLLFFFLCFYFSFVFIFPLFVFFPLFLFLLCCSSFLFLCFDTMTLMTAVAHMALHVGV